MVLKQGGCCCHPRALQHSVVPCSHCPQFSQQPQESSSIPNLIAFRLPQGDLLCTTRCRCAKAAFALTMGRGGQDCTSASIALLPRGRSAQWWDRFVQPCTDAVLLTSWCWGWRDHCSPQPMAEALRTSCFGRAAQERFLRYSDISLCCPRPQC